MLHKQQFQRYCGFLVSVLVSDESCSVSAHTDYRYTDNQVNWSCIKHISFSYAVHIKAVKEFQTNKKG